MLFWHVGSSMTVVPVPAYVAAVDDPLSLMASLTRCDVSLIVNPVGCFPQLSLYLEGKHGWMHVDVGFRVCNMLHGKRA